MVRLGWYGCPLSLIGKPVRDPSPSWPLQFRPHTKTEPSRVSTLVCPHPADTCGKTVQKFERKHLRVERKKERKKNLIYIYV